MESERPESEGWQTGSTKFAGYALFDEVRRRIFNRYENSLDLLEANTKYISQGFLPKYLYEFIATVGALYVELEPKLKYGNEKDKFDDLIKIKTLLRSGQFTLPGVQLARLEKVDDEEQKKSLALYFQFVDYFFTIRSFIEENGITKYEQAEHDLAEMIMRGLKAKG
jgi:hypothetical protein